MTFEELMDSTPPMQQHALVKGYQAGFAAGAASRDAEVAKAFEDGRKAEREAIVKDLLPPIATPQTKAHYIANEIADALCKAIRARSKK